MALTLQFGVKGLSEVDELDGQFAVSHDVGGFQVQMGDLVLGEVA